MVLLQSKDYVSGFHCPDFSLPSVDNKRYSLHDFSEAKALLVAFICNHCPYVRAIEDRLIALGKQFDKSQLQIVGICSNDAKEYPDDSPENLLKRWKEKDYGFVYLIDEEQTVAKKFNAICTPDLFLFDGDRQLFYHGQLDDNWQNPEQVQSHDLKDAVVALNNGQAAPQDQKPSMGCSIKWKKES